MTTSHVRPIMLANLSASARRVSARRAAASSQASMTRWTSQMPAPATYPSTGPPRRITIGAANTISTTSR